MSAERNFWRQAMRRALQTAKLVEHEQRAIVGTM